MAIMYKPDEHAFFTQGASLTEPEHLDSCDINKMMKKALQGMQIRGSQSTPNFGYDDTTMDGLTLRINKQTLERELNETAQSMEFSPEELDAIPKAVKEKFNFKLRKKGQANKTNELNDQNKKPAQNSQNEQVQKDGRQTAVKPDGAPSSSDTDV